MNDFEEPSWRLRRLENDVAKLMGVLCLLGAIWGGVAAYALGRLDGLAAAVETFQDQQKCLYESAEAEGPRFWACEPLGAE